MNNGIVKLHPGSQAEGAENMVEVDISRITVPDIWHIAQANKDPMQQQMLLQCWHLAHDLKDHIYQHQHR